MDDSQVLYLGRWVSREHFKVFVYNKTDKKLVKSYDEYCKAISSGLWQASPIAVNDKQQFNKNELIESQEIEENLTPSIIEKQLLAVDEENVIDIKPKKGRPCLNQKKV